MTKKYIFCDVDETVINLKSMFSFHDYWFKQWLPTQSEDRAQLDAWQAEYEDINGIMQTLRRQGASREELNRRYYEFFVGRSMSQIEQCVQAWFRDTSADPQFWLAETNQEIRRLEGLGYVPVFVSGSMNEILQPIAQAFGVQHVLGTKLQVNGDKISGRILPPQMIGAGKATAIAMFIAQHDARAEDCYAMGDDISDLAMLQSVGHAIAVIGDPLLYEQALARGWDSILLNHEAALSE
jgi:HAD superfamily hydrolase (TIGR01490 family)